MSPHADELVAAAAERSCDRLIDSRGGRTRDGARFLPTSGRGRDEAIAGVIAAHNQHIYRALERGCPRESKNGTVRVYWSL